MKKFEIGTYNFNMEELEGISFLEDYEITSFDALEYQNRDAKLCLLILRNVPDSAELWKKIREMEIHRKSVCFLFLIQKEDFSFTYHACRQQNVFVFNEKDGREAFTEYMRDAVARLGILEYIEAGTKQLAEYEYYKHQKIMDRLLDNILKKPKEVEALLPEINKRYGTKLKEHNYEAFIINVNQYELGIQASLLNKEITLFALHTLQSADELIMGFHEPYGIIGILHCASGTLNAERKREYEKLWHRIMTLQNRYGEFRITLSVGEMVENIAEIGNSLEQAALVREYYITTGKYVLFAEEIEGVQQELSDYIPKQKIKELIRFVSLGDVRHVNSWFLLFHQVIEPGFLKYPPAFTKFCWNVYVAISENEKTAKVSEYPEWKFLTLHHVVDGFERCRKLEELLIEICYMVKQENEDSQEIATKAIDYMKEHYMEPLNLDFIAEECGLSTSYFSRKFKEQTGENYIDVLTDIRIREAQRLLGTTDLPIGEIVEKVGYCDDKHFRRVFQKATGMRPAEYRKKIKIEKFG
uniref:helix-turn-helix domain-containing protein n=1 Tax=Agathobacter sp. TaxID=2021311 RepID=UPI004056437F